MAISDVVADSRRIRAHLCDEESRFVYDKRVLFSMTQEWQSIRELVMHSAQMFSGGGTLISALQSLRPKYLFGVNWCAHVFAQLWQGSFRAVVDNDAQKWGGRFDGLPIIGPTELPLSEQPLVFVAVRAAHGEVCRQLYEMGLSDADVIDVSVTWNDISNHQYFGLDCLVHSPKEVFADVGALDGRTAASFLRWSGGQFEHVYCFEPMPKNIETLTQRFADLHEQGKFDVIGKAVGDAMGEQSFSVGSTMVNSMGEGAQATFPVTTLDQELAGKGVTFLTMDIEGAEMAALRGAERLIREERPKLAISVYHKPEDIFEIPALLLRHHADYKFYLRHYYLWWQDTVLYAV